MYKLDQDEIRKKLEIRIPRWEEFPDFPIYNEQLITFIEQTVENLMEDGERIITKSMINNYVKWKMVPKPEKKKYHRIHIAYCMVITILKPVLNIKEIHQGIKMQTKLMGEQDAYNAFCDSLEKTISETFTPLKETTEPYKWQAYQAEDKNLAISSVCRSLCYKIITEMVLKQKNRTVNEDGHGVHIAEEGDHA